MSRKNRSFLLSSLLPAFLVVSAFAVMGAQEGRAQSAKATNWSDPATWPNRKVAAAQAAIAKNKSTFTLLGVNQIKGPTGFAARFRELGYTVEEPGPPP